MTQANADAGVFLVDDAIFSASEARLMTQQEQSAAIPPRPLDEILYIASVLAQRQLPVDIVNNILEFAGVLLSFQAESTERLPARGDMNEVYLQLQLPTAEELHVPVGLNLSKCALVVADCTSKDQGWATDGREHNGTYRGSSSWNEITVTSTNEVGESTEKARVPFCPNLRAGRNFRHHRRYFFSDSTGLLENIQLGDTVAIVLRSQYPGWTNTARYGKLAVCFAVELTDEFSFVDIPFPNRADETSAEPEAMISCSIH
ncbi:hypothetical protein PHYBOEH_005751 [Phytophthora boehmeriae]|uniref:Uncharacterized protein n=1 Tax=Phytophthora boehmeriae TaxID=109152 RepID=A0A8T1XD31_9STRA|nr:hypothetical protein PHYBOEH_005751 [Phytophthora boehmeriae]